MGYVIAALLVLLIVGGFVFFLVTNATKKSNLSPDSTPAGDTSEHAGEQTEEGTTVGGQDAGAHGGTGAPPKPPGDAHRDDPEVARPVVGGEAEGERSAT